MIMSLTEKQDSGSWKQITFKNFFKITHYFTSNSSSIICKGHFLGVIFLYSFKRNNWLILNNVSSALSGWLCYDNISEWNKPASYWIWHGRYVIKASPQNNYWKFQCNHKSNQTKQYYFAWSSYYMHLNFIWKNTVMNGNFLITELTEVKEGNSPSHSNNYCI